MRCDYGTNIRKLLTILISHYAHMREERARKMELADLHSIRLENEGYSPCRALVIVMKQGTTLGVVKLVRAYETRMSRFVLMVFSDFIYFGGGIASRNHYQISQLHGTGTL
ncbi:LOW QUALITY PROTEIN: Hypothetical protein PHPALM_14135 [Phytophthora palmivora]|uniref:Uncharacterized protein n=1 Tax=Phytophthora palmivora TaxID=4796 RepID=A0A2P4XVI5_9STRA|nr:LOW QUALITY PROTEIN: Hypothetical protein PHPALM_14135 [Phytophthora palmivora]